VPNSHPIAGRVGSEQPAGNNQRKSRNGAGDSRLPQEATARDKMGSFYLHCLTVGILFTSIICMPVHVRLFRFRACCKAASLSVLFFALCQNSAQAVWQRDDTSLTWRAGTNIVWRFNFDSRKGKPFFHPLSVDGGPSLTNFKPEDHPWHYGLWFSWKYINHPDSTNHVNYWEEDRATGHAQGRTLWTRPVIQTTPQGDATIQLDLAYVNPSNHVDMTERRQIIVTAPDAGGAYTINWKAHFVVGDEAVVLDRTPMPGEPGGQINGGYAGLAFRMAALPLNVSMLSTAGPITNFVGNRARPAAPAVAFNFTEDGKEAGSMAILSDKANAGENAPWYLINEAKRMFRFACAAILAPKPLSLPARDQMGLNYCISIQPQAWTVESLREEQSHWSASLANRPQQPP
jgi:hypothetical protein